MARDIQIGALWTGGALGFVQLLGLRSFLDAGQHVKLFSYGPVEGAPDEIEIADANDVLPLDAGTGTDDTASAARQIDRFRYHLLAQHDDMVWADPDTYCVQPFTTGTGHLHGWQSELHVGTSVLGLPPDSETLRLLIDFTSDTQAIPPWLSPEERQALEDEPPVDGHDQVQDVWGAPALTWFLRQTGEIRYTLLRAALYPVAKADAGVLLRPDGSADGAITPQTLAVPLYADRAQTRLQRTKGGVPDPKSLMGRLLARHGIDPADAPLPGVSEASPPAAPVAEPLDPGDRHGRGVVNLTDLADAAGSDRGSRKHRFTELYQMLFHPMRDRPLHVALLGLDGGLGVQDPDAAPAVAEAMLKMWLAYFPNARFTAFDMAEEVPFDDPRVAYVTTDFEDPATLTAALDGAPEVIIDDATHASRHQQSAFVDLFPRLASGGLYIIEDLRFQPTPLEGQGSVKTAALFQGYQETGVFEHPDAATCTALNAMRVDFSGCFLFPAQYIKHRRDQLLVVHKR